MRTSSLGLLLPIALVAAACGDGGGPARPDLGTDAAVVDGGGTDAGTADSGADVDAGGCAVLGRESVATGLGTDLVYATAPQGDDRVFVAQRTRGTVRVVDASGARPTPYLTIPAASLSTTGFEAGLLGLAFHPDFAATPRVFVSYTTTGHALRVARFTATSAAADSVDAASETTVLEVPILDAASVAHVGGFLAFGPDGYLYVGIGDMQPAGDATMVAQDLGQLPGKILRLDVDVDVGAVHYAVPAGNPLAGMPGRRGEIWASGVREPFRFSFDAAGDLFVGDVGDSHWEEVDVIAAGDGGRNLGWPIAEGDHCHTPATGCDLSGLTAPAYEYAHPATSAVVVAGPVYAGTALPACLQGHFFFGDYLGGWVRSLTWDAVGGAKNVEEHAGLAGGMPVALGVDGRGELLVVAPNGNLDRIVAR